MAGIRGTLWEGVALRRTRAAADPDAAPRTVALPAGWLIDPNDDAAAGLAALLPGNGPITLPRAAEAWIGRAVDGGRRAELLDGPAAHRFAEALRALLLSRRGAPGIEVWRGDDAKGQEPRFVLNLSAFLEPEGGFDLEGYGAACGIGIRALECLTNARASRLRLGFADLAGLLTGLRLHYDSSEGRAVAAGLAALTHGAAAAESGRIAALLGARNLVALPWPTPPPDTLVPGLAAAARAALGAAAALPGLRHGALVSLARADATEALLGAGSGGIAPAPGSASAAPGAMAGPVDEVARRAMRDAVAPFLHAMPPAPVALPAPPRPAPAPVGDTHEQAPLLPLDLPPGFAPGARHRPRGRRRGLRLVG